MVRRAEAPPPEPGLLDLLGDVPSVQVEPIPDEHAWGAIKVTWHRPPKGRHLCQDCVEAIHGKQGGRQPLAATAARKGPNGTRLLCAIHAEEHKRLDAKAKREYEERRAAAEHAARGRR